MIVNVEHESFAAISAAIEELRGREIAISYRVRGTRTLAAIKVTNAEQALSARLANRQHVAAQRRRWPKF